MQPVDNFSAPAVGALVDQRWCVSSRGSAVRCRDSPVGDLSAIAGTTSNAGERGHGTVFAAGVRGRLPRPQREGSFSGAAESCERTSSTDPPQTIEIGTCLPRYASRSSSA